MAVRADKQGWVRLSVPWTEPRACADASAEHSGADRQTQECQWETWASPASCTGEQTTVREGHPAGLAVFQA